MIAGTWLDPVVGVDIHWVLVPTPPGAPVPTPLPHPFVGIVFDPLGLVVGTAISAGISLATGAPITGPVLINNLPASNTGTEGTNKIVLPHFPTPPGVAWAPVPAGLKPPIPGKAPDPGVPTPVPSNDAVIITGSKTVYVMGTNATRLGDLAMSCGEPIRLPSSTVIAVPKGPPVLIGGPPALDFMAAGFGAIRTSWVSGRLNALATRVFGEGSRGANWASKIICFFTGHPVDVATGMVMVDATDFALPGPIPLRFTRTYYSRSTYRGPLGTGWNHAYDQWISVDGRTATYHDGDGREIYFRAPAAGESVFHRPERLTLTATAAGYVIRRHDGIVLRFERAGDDDIARLVRIEDRNGQNIALAYDERHRLARLRDCGGRIFAFEYDERDLLVRITGPHPVHEGHRATIVSYEYDEHGDCVAAIDALGNARRYAYVNHLLVTETDRLGHSFHFAYDGCDADARCVRTWGDGGVWDHVIRYDVPGGRTIVEDSFGNPTIYEIHESGRVGAVIDGMGGTTRYTFNEWGDVVGTESPDGTSSRQEYDAFGNLTRIERSSGEWHVRECDGNGNPVRVQSTDGGTWHHEYDERGNLIRTVNALGTEDALQYDRQGRLVQIRGRSTEIFVYDDRHDLVEWRSSDGSVTRYGRGPWGQITWSVDSLGAREQREYDAKCRLVRRVREDGAFIEYGYDAEDRLIRVRDSSGALTEYTYSATGRITSRRRNGTLDARYDRDADDALIGIELPIGARHRLDYDAAGRLASEITAAGVEYLYQPAGGDLRITERSAAGNGPNGWVSRVVSPDGDASEDAAVELGWNEAGNLIRDGREPHVITHAYGGRGELLQTDFPSGSRLFTGYDAHGRLSECRAEWHDGSESTARFRYDERGVLAGFEAGPVAMLQNVDRYGHISEQVFRFADEERRREYEYDALGKLRRIRDSHFGECTIGYDAAGRLTRIDGFGVSPIIIDRSTPGQPVRTDAAPATILSGGRVMVGDGVVPPVDYGDVPTRLNRGTTLRLVHDQQHRLREVVDPSGRTVATYAYDILGRRVRKVVDGRVREFFWSGPRLLAERADSRWFEHVFAGWLPIFWWNDTEALTVFCDRRGQPLATADTRGRALWHGPAIPYAELDPSPARPPWVGVNEYHDDESGLLYNYARYFDPLTLRYTTPDPIGVFGGDDLYLGVADPFTQFDILGFHPASFSDRNTRQVDYWDNDFQNELDQAHRRGFTDRPSVQNVAVVELQDGTKIPFASGGGHSEHHMIDWLNQMKAKGIQPTDVVRIYSELSPCAGDVLKGKDGCLKELADYFGDHIKKIKLEFSWFHGNKAQNAARLREKWRRMERANSC